MNIKIRVATESDAPVLTQFRYELRSSGRELVESEEEFSKRCTLWMMARLHSRSCWRCWIAEYEQTSVGNIWTQLEQYVTEHSGALFSHSLCPDCYDTEMKPQLDKLK